MIINILRWTARITGGMIFLIWGFLFIADLFGPNVHKDINPIDFKSVSYLTLMVISILGLALAWKWEFAGGIITLSAYILNAIINPKIIVIYIHFIFPLLAIVFIVVWFISRKKRSIEGFLE